MANTPTSQSKNKGSCPCFVPFLPEGNQGHTENTLTSLDLTLLGSSSSSVYTSSLLTTSCEPSSNSTYQGNKGLKLSCRSLVHHARWPFPAISCRHRKGLEHWSKACHVWSHTRQTGHRAAPALKRVVTNTLSSPLPTAKTCPASGSRGKHWTNQAPASPYPQQSLWLPGTSGWGGRPQTWLHRLGRLSISPGLLPLQQEDPAGDSPDSEGTVRRRVKGRSIWETCLSPSLPAISAGCCCSRWQKKQL